MDAKDHEFSIEIEVRDYELDLQGIVNNSVYQNYLEHCRHSYLKVIGLDFAALHADGIDPVVARIEIDYRSPLTSGDRCMVTIATERLGRLQFVFYQNIYRLPDLKEIVRAKVNAACISGGRPVIPERILQAIDAYKSGRPA